MPNNLCCVLIPSGQTVAADGTAVDFDAVYHELIVPAVRDAGLDPVLLDPGQAGGGLDRTDLERLILCPFAVVDLTGAGPGTHFDLGVRTGAHPGATVAVCAEDRRHHVAVPVPLRVVPYGLTPAGSPAGVPKARRAVARRLLDARELASRGPLAENSIDRLVNDFVGVQHTKTDVFRDRVHYSETIKRQLAEARKQGADSVRAVEAHLEAPVEAGVLIDLMLSYRAVKAWQDVVRLVDKMPKPLAASVMVREQLAFALNRAGRGEEAERVLLAILAAHGPSSETWALLGRVYKDRWEATLKAGDTERAREILDKAIDAYLKGFEADWRDGLPGINAVTLMELREPPDPRRLDLIPVVAYAVERRIASGAPDYWDYASRIELAVLASRQERALQALDDALGHIREVWEPETTRRNMRLIREVRERRGEPVDLVRRIEERLAQAGAKAG
jgi:tetratricopeptide (TPR) repeat protein